MRWFGKEVAGGSIRAVVFYITTKYILPLGAPIVTAIIGLRSGLPWFWIWLGALAAFAFISTGLLRFDEWLARRRVEGKLFLLQPGAVTVLNQGYALGVQFHNSAVFPIEVEIIELRTQLNNKVPTKRVGSKKMVVQPNVSGWFYDYPIDFEPPKPGSAEGTLEAKIKYGLVGSQLKYELEEKKQITARFDEEGKWAGNAIWTDMIRG